MYVHILQTLSVGTFYMVCLTTLFAIAVCCNTPEIINLNTQAIANQSHIRTNVWLGNIQITIYVIMSCIYVALQV